MRTEHITYFTGCSANQAADEVFHQHDQGPHQCVPRLSIGVRSYLNMHLAVLPAVHSCSLLFDLSAGQGDLRVNHDG